MAASSPLDAFRLDGKVAVVTGSSRGIGRAIAFGLAGVGATVVVNSRNAGDVAAVAIEIASKYSMATPIVADISRPEDVRRLFTQVMDMYGHIDVLVNNAGISPVYKRAEDVLEAEWDAVMATNLKGMFLCAQAAGRLMLAQGSGSIVNMSSIGGSAALARILAYCVSKAGIEQMTRVMAVEWAQRGVRVNAIAPTWVETDLARGVLENPRLSEWVAQQTPMGKAAQPDDIVGAAIYLASDASRFVTGHILRVDGGWTAW